MDVELISTISATDGRANCPVRAIFDPIPEVTAGLQDVRTRFEEVARQPAAQPGFHGGRQRIGVV